MDICFWNWKCLSYGLSGDNKHKEWSYQDLKKYFDIRGGAVCKCITPILDYEPGKFYLISDGSWHGYGFVIGQHGFRSWTDWEEFA